MSLTGRAAAAGRAILSAIVEEPPPLRWQEPVDGRPFVTCIEPGCSMTFYAVDGRPDYCLDHNAERMRAAGHQNDPRYSVD